MVKLYQLEDKYKNTLQVKLAIRQIKQINKIPI
jgi:hypothetical protein